MIADKNADDRRCVYLLIGDEEFLKEEWLQATRQKFFSAGGGSATLDNKNGGKRNSTPDTPDYSLFFADDAKSPADILAIARTRPFLNPKRLIVIKNIELLDSSAHREQILNYAKSPSVNSVLILDADLSQKDFLKNSFLTELGKLSQVVAFKKLYDANLYSWISKMALLRKKRIEPGASELLRQLKGNNLRAIDEEIEKLSIYVGEKALITEADARQLTGRDISGTVYDMVDALARKDKKRALALSFDFQKRDLGSSVGLFCWNLRLLLRIKEGTANLASLQKFQLERAQNQALRLPLGWLKKALAELTEFDLQLKTSGFSDSFLGWQMVLIRLLEALP